MRKPLGQVALALNLIIAIFVIGSLGFVCYELSRILLARQQLQHGLELAALAGGADMASDSLSGDAAQQNATLVATNIMRMNSILGRPLTSSVMVATSMTALAPTSGQVSVYYEFDDPITKQPSPTGNVLRVYGAYAYPLFSGGFGAIGVSVWTVAAEAVAGLPTIDLEIVYSNDGAMDDQTPATLVRRYWDPTTPAIAYFVPTGPGGIESGPIWSLACANLIGSNTNGLPPQNLAAMGDPNLTNCWKEFSEEGPIGNTVPLRGVTNTGAPPGCAPPATGGVGVAGLTPGPGPSGGGGCGCGGKAGGSSGGCTGGSTGGCTGGSTGGCTGGSTGNPPSSCSGGNSGCSTGTTGCTGGTTGCTGGTTGCSSTGGCSSTSGCSSTGGCSSTSGCSSPGGCSSSGGCSGGSGGCGGDGGDAGDGGDGGCWLPPVQQPIPGKDPAWWTQLAALFQHVHLEQAAKANPTAGPDFGTAGYNPWGADTTMFSDLVVNLDGKNVFGGYTPPPGPFAAYPFPTLDFLVEASRGNLENIGVTPSTHVDNPMYGGKAGYKNAYQCLSYGNLQPKSLCEQSINSFMGKIMQTADAHFGFVGFNDRAGNSPTDTNKAATVSMFYPPAGTTNYLVPTIALAPDANNMTTIQTLLSPPTNSNVPNFVPNGQSNLASGLQNAYNQLTGAGSRPGSFKAIVVFTDTVPTRDLAGNVYTSPAANAGALSDALNVATNCKNQGIPIFLVALDQTGGNMTPYFQTQFNDQPGSGGLVGTAGHGGQLYIVPWGASAASTSPPYVGVCNNVVRQLMTLESASEK